MSIKNTMTEQVAAQIDRQWPYSRLNVTSTGSGEYVAVGPNSVQLTDDYWHVPARAAEPPVRVRRRGPRRHLGHPHGEAVAHNGRASVKDRVTAFDARCQVRRIGLVHVIELPGGEGAVIAPLDGGITLTYGEETHRFPTIGHAVMAVGAILSQE